ncbi:MAG TPA: CBS domain-containing protein [Oligoflexia bacterium]|nr:CBS domain-containing protein [Oligoflexia bacterium]
MFANQNNPEFNFGAIDNRFLAGSVGLLNPREPLTLPETAVLGQGLSFLREHKVGAVVITDAHGKVVGIFTERDVILRVALQGLHIESALKSVMTIKPKTIRMTTTIAYALQLMSEQGFRHLPIVDDDNIPVGIISVKNIIDYLVRTVTGAISELAGSSEP